MWHVRTPTTRRAGASVLTQVLFWISALLVGAFVYFPSYAGVVARVVYGDGPPRRPFRPTRRLSYSDTPSKE